MEYIYAAKLLDKAGTPLNEGNVKKVLESAGVKVDEARVKALIAALDGVNIEEAMKKQAIAQAPVAQVTSDHKSPAKEEKKEEKKVDDMAAAAGLSALFG